MRNYNYALDRSKLRSHNPNHLLGVLLPQLLRSEKSVSRFAVETSFGTAVRMCRWLAQGLRTKGS